MAGRDHWHYFRSGAAARGQSFLALVLGQALLAHPDIVVSMAVSSSSVIDFLFSISNSHDSLSMYRDSLKHPTARSLTKIPSPKMRNRPPGCLSATQVETHLCLDGVLSETIPCSSGPWDLCGTCRHPQRYRYLRSSLPQFWC